MDDNFADIFQYVAPPELGGVPYTPNERYVPPVAQPPPPPPPPVFPTPTIVSTGTKLAENETPNLTPWLIAGGLIVAYLVLKK